MNVRNSGIADKILNPAERLADNGRAQVPHMQGFGDIGTAVIQNHGMGIFNLFHAETAVGSCLIHNFSDKGICHGHIDKAGAVNRNFGQIGIFFQFCGNQGGNFTRIFSFLFSQGKSPVALKIAQVRAV